MLVGLFAAVFVAGSAQAGKAPGWTQITAANGSNTVEVSPARTRDGVLHVAWVRANGSGGADLMHSELSPNGKPVGSPNAIVSGWTSLTAPTLAVAPDGILRVFFSGLRSTNSNDPYVSGAAFTATSPASGKSWSLDSGSMSQESAYGSNVIGGAFTRDGTPAAAWASSLKLGVHIGIDQANPAGSPDKVLQTDCCSYEPALATDQATGALVLGWFSNATARPGIYTQTVSPAIGALQLAPGSITTYNGARNTLAEDGQTPLVARVGGGVFMAYCSGYPTCGRVLVWRVGSSNAAIVGTGVGARSAMLARGPDGRFWVAWQKDTVIHARRSNAAATIFGAAVTVRPPQGTASIYRLNGEGSLGPLDLFAHVGIGASTTASSWTTRLLPGLSLSASPAGLSAKQGGRVAFRVTDAGDPVAGALVSVGGRSAKANSQGQASLSFSRGRTSYLALATKPGYTGASVRVAAR